MKLDPVRALPFWPWLLSKKLMPVTVAVPCRPTKTVRPAATWSQLIKVADPVQYRLAH
jgi:hypothetical protein